MTLSATGSRVKPRCGPAHESAVTIREHGVIVRQGLRFRSGRAPPPIQFRLRVHEGMVAFFRRRRHPGFCRAAALVKSWMRTFLPNLTSMAETNCPAPRPAENRSNGSAGKLTETNPPGALARAGRVPDLPMYFSLTSGSPAPLSPECPAPAPPTGFEPFSAREDL